MLCFSCVTLWWHLPARGGASVVRVVASFEHGLLRAVWRPRVLDVVVHRASLRHGRVVRLLSAAVALQPLRLAAFLADAVLRLRVFLRLPRLLRRPATALPLPLLLPLLAERGVAPADVGERRVDRVEARAGVGVGVPARAHQPVHAPRVLVGERRRLAHAPAARHEVERLLVGHPGVRRLAALEDLPEHDAEAPHVRLGREAPVQDRLRRGPLDGAEPRRRLVLARADGAAQPKVGDLHGEDVVLPARHEQVARGEVAVDDAVVREVVHPRAGADREREQRVEAQRAVLAEELVEAAQREVLRADEALARLAVGVQPVQDHAVRVPQRLEQRQLVLELPVVLLQQLLHRHGRRPLPQPLVHRPEVPAADLPHLGDRRERALVGQPAGRRGRRRARGARRTLLLQQLAPQAEAHAHLQPQRLQVVLAQQPQRGERRDLLGGERAVRGLEPALPQPRPQLVGRPEVRRARHARRRLRGGRGHARHARHGRGAVGLRAGGVRVRVPRAALAAVAERRHREVEAEHLLVEAAPVRRIRDPARRVHDVVRHGEREARARVDRRVVDRHGRVPPPRLELVHREVHARGAPRRPAEHDDDGTPCAVCRRPRHRRRLAVPGACRERRARRRRRPRAPQRRVERARACGRRLCVVPRARPLAPAARPEQQRRGGAGRRGQRRGGRRQRVCGARSARGACGGFQRGADDGAGDAPRLVAARAACAARARRERAVHELGVHHRTVPGALAQVLLGRVHRVPAARAEAVLVEVAEVAAALRLAAEDVHEPPHDDGGVHAARRGHGAPATVLDLAPLRTGKVEAVHVVHEHPRLPAEDVHRAVVHHRGVLRARRRRRARRGDRLPAVLLEVERPQIVQLEVLRQPAEDVHLVPVHHRGVRVSRLGEGSLDDQRLPLAELFLKANEINNQK